MNGFRNVALALVFAALGGAALAQEPTPVPKDSMRVSVNGCTRGYIFTVAARTANQAGTEFDIPEGMHLRMNGPKKMMSEIKAHEGSMVQITGLMKKGQYAPGGVSIGGGVRVGPGPTGGGLSPVDQAFIDVEGWRPIEGSCPTKR